MKLILRNEDTALNVYYNRLLAIIFTFFFKSSKRLMSLRSVLRRPGHQMY